MSSLMNLASVCSDRYMSERENDSLTKNNTEARKTKPLRIVDFTCKEDLRALNTKTLVEKFAEPTSDEIKRRFSYKCIILPEECNQVFESYGSEKRAYDQMKPHLLHHILEIEERMSNGAWPPKSESMDIDIQTSPNTTTKAGKRSLKSQHLSGVKIPTKKQKTTNKRKPKTTKSSNSPPKERTSNGIHSSKAILRSVPSPSNAEKPSSNFKPSSLGFSVEVPENEANMVCEEIVQDNTYEICGPLCNHVNCSRSQRSSSTDEQSTSDASNASTCNEEDITMIRGIYLEHSYTSRYGIKKEEEPLQIKNRKPKRRRGCCIPEQLVICTPPFPYVHVPVLPDCVGIEETKTMDVMTEVYKESVDNSSYNREIEEEKVNDLLPSLPKIKEETKLPRNATVSGSVLECVENRVSVNTCATRFSKDPSLSPEHSIENDENLQKKAVREKALRLMNKLKSKKKNNTKAL